MRRLFLLPALVLLAACQGAAPGLDEHVVSVQGRGEVRATPDVADVALQVEARATTLKAARTEAETAVRRLLALTEKLGIPAENVRSANAVSRAEHDYVDGRQEFRGYWVQRGVEIRVTDLGQLGPLYDGAFKVGITNVNPPVLGVSNPRERYREALRLAAQDARANADLLATTLDGRLGGLLRISTAANGDMPPPQPMMMMRSREAAADASMEMHAGEITFTADVHATFELER